ncbi:MAG: hypothetical protein IPM54_24350 [Polyangiaceae bacterium]|nr:hypothetical protein [Polyangiaceae bacterium]
MNSYLGDGHPCFIGKLQGACAASGCAIPCASSSQCNDGLPCTKGECRGGVCVIEHDDYAAAPDDGNACTEEHCSGGKVVSWKMPDGSTCPGGECEVGVCGRCDVAADCGANTECTRWECVKEKCVQEPKPYGYSVPSGDVLGDCRVWVCDGYGGKVAKPDPTDIPFNYEPCFDWLCVGLTPVRIPRIGDKCLMDGGLIGVCSSEGACVQCVQDVDCGPGFRCKDAICWKCGDAEPDGDEVCGGACGACKGSACVGDKDCASGYCVATNAQPAKVCCGAPCDGTCQQCAATGANAGQCIFVPTGQQDDTCITPGMGCFAGTCKWKTGYPCVQPSDCISGKCINGTCAN